VVNFALTVIQKIYKEKKKAQKNKSTIVRLIMTNKDKIKYLSQYKKLLIEHKQIYINYEKMREKLEFPAISAQVMMLTPTSSNMPCNPVEAEYFRLLSLEELLNEILIRLRNIEKSINQLEDSIQRTVLRLRYIDGMTWEKICVNINYEWAWTHRIHSNALRNIEIT